MIELESLLDAYVDRLGISYEDDEAVLETLARLETHRFGIHRTMRRMTMGDLKRARPRPVFVAIYPAPFFVAVGDSTATSISDNGRFVAFQSVASNLVPNDTNGTEDIFVRDLSALVPPVGAPVK